ncbi:dihydrodipicolinate synthase family protein [Pararobbsia alpina]|uniref:dihydrodipicolinate synthase family protein n=1 Tax=Pararobbsia alpina TaxID=621374 RepID=UPI0031B5B0E6
MISNHRMRERFKCPDLFGPDHGIAQPSRNEYERRAHHDTPLRQGHHAGRGRRTSSAHGLRRDDREIHAGRLERGRALFHELAPLIRALSSEPNPAPVKSALSILELIHDELRPPMTRASATLQTTIAQLM